MTSACHKSPRDWPKHDETMHHPRAAKLSKKHEHSRHDFVQFMERYSHEDGEED